MKRLLCEKCYSELTECTFQGKHGPYRWKACTNQQCVLYRQIQSGREFPSFEEGPSYVWTPADRSSPEMIAALKRLKERPKP